MTLVQADASPETLEALTRDPHAQVRRVVAAHPRISEEVAFRLSEDQQPSVRLALRRNPACHPILAAAVAVADQPRGRSEELATAEHLLEIAWQARRAGIPAGELAELIEEWTGLGRDDLERMALEQAALVLEVLAAKLGQGRMPSRSKKAKKTKAAAKSSRRKR